MKDVLAALNELRAKAAEYATIRDATADPSKKQLFDRLAQHLEVLASEVAASASGEVGARGDPGDAD